MTTHTTTPVIESLKRLIACPSVTPHEAGTFEIVKTLLPEFDILEIPNNLVSNLFLFKRYGKGPHVCFAGHVDVVPSGEGWKYNPFHPVVHQGYLYGRGAQDMKSGVAASVQALKECAHFCGTLSMLLTSDEEGEAIDGTRHCLPILEEKGLLPDYAIVAEPTSEARFGDALKVGRRGSINGILTVKGRQGHAAYPEKAINPIDVIAPILPALSGAHLDEGDDYFSPSRFIVTDIRAGMEVTNVTPGELKMMFNVRNSTRITQEDVETFIRQHMRDAQYHLEMSQSSHPFVTSSQSPLIGALEKAIVRVCGVEARRSTAGGTSDARYFAAHGVDVVEFGVVNDRIHAIDERVPVADVNQLKEVFSLLLKTLETSMM
jgi:succinyl-diaminopimelate desuccinylase